jgi:processive 1,2-diacylglycerol beta-glucosyltransferase
MRAAQAVELALREVVPEAKVRNMDVLDFTNTAFRRVYGEAYLDLVNKAPHVLGYFYDLLDRPGEPGKKKRDHLRLAVQKLNLKRFIRFLTDEACDLVINTHFLPAEIIASLRRQGQFSAPQAIVTTDFETHRLWVHQPCERYFTATEEGALYLQSWGVPAQGTVATGIPIHPAFSRTKDRAQCLAAHKLAGDRPIILQLAGGFGVGPIERIYRALLDVEIPLDVVAVTGRNEKAGEQLRALPAPERHRTHVIGFTDQMDEWMAMADLVASKPGGLTTSEALACGLPMVIINPIPGQESRNSDFLLENGAAIKVNNVATMGHKITALLHDQARLHEIKANARRLGRPRAAYEVVRHCLGLLKSPTLE